MSDIAEVPFEPEDREDLTHPMPEGAGSSSSHPRSPLLRIPERLGRYEIKSLLGRGGMGAVYLGFDTQLGRQVAIKILPDETSRQPRARERFLREAQAAAALNHPGICTIHSIEEDGEILFLVLEYIQGRSFRALTVDGASGWPPEPAVAAGYILQIAEALAAAHDVGIIHRDIKSSNLMRTPTGRVKVLDFGLAKISGAAPLTGEGLHLGTPAYASPEQIRGEPIDVRTDLWSLGIVFYEILTGHLPFDGDNTAALVHALLSGDPQPVRQLRPGISAALARVVERLLVKNRERRMASALALIDELRPLAQAAPEEIETTSLKPSFKPFKPGTQGSGSRTHMETLLGTAERRTVTFLYMELASAVASDDPEDFQTALEQSREVCAKVVARHQGSMQPWTGNAAMAYFGYPEALEKAAALAVSAGLALAGVFGRGQAGFHFRAGVATSLTVADIGGVGAISGEGFELARTLAHRAGTNEVLIGETTKTHVAGHFELGQEEEMPIGGRQVRCWQVLHASTARSRFQLMPRAALTPLAGRDHELHLLLRQWQGAIEGHGHITLIGAEPGLGKSRLAYELKQNVARNPAAALIECFCGQQYANSALFPVVDCLERLWFESEVRAMQPGEKLRVIEGGLAELGFALPTTVPLFAQLLGVPAPQYPPLEITPERQRLLTLQALVNIVVERASRQPLLFVVEDLHWADPTTLEMLRMMVDQVPTVRLMALYTHRPEYAAEWLHRGHVSSIALDRLSRADSLALASCAARGEALDSGTMAQIVGNSDGVPLFLEELTKTVAESGAGSSSTGKMPVPGSLSDSFIARLDQLGAPRNVARMASVLGREFPQGLLAAVSELPEDELQRSLDRLVEAEVFYVRGSGRRRTYIFKHALLQNAAYDSLLKKARLALHQQVAELLVREFPEMAARQPEVVAGHFTEAGLGEQSIGYWHQAGMSALQRSAHLEALSHFERGLDVFRALSKDRSNPEQELLLLSGLGPALIATRGFGAAEVGEVYARAEALLPRDSSSALVLPTLWGVWVYNLVRSRLEHALKTTLRMIEAGRRMNENGLVLEGLWTAGNTLYWMGDLRAARRYLDEAEALYDPVRFGQHAYLFGQDSLVATLCYQSFVYCFLGFFDKAIAAGDRSIETARSLRHPFSIGWALTFRATLDCFLGDFRGARMLGDQAVEYCREQGYPFWISAGLAASGESLAKMGDKRYGLEQVWEGIGRLREGIAMTQAIGSRVIEPLFRGQLTEALLRAGESEAALAESEDAIRQAEEQGVRVSLLDLRRVRGLALLGVGRREEGEAAIRETIAASRAASCRYVELRAATDLAELTGETAALAQVYAGFSGDKSKAPVLGRAREILEKS